MIIFRVFFSLELLLLWYYYYLDDGPCVELAHCPVPDQVQCFPDLAKSLLDRLDLLVFLLQAQVELVTENPTDFLAHLALGWK